MEYLKSAYKQGRFRWRNSEHQACLVRGGCQSEQRVWDPKEKTENRQKSPRLGNGYTQILGVCTGSVHTLNYKAISGRFPPSGKLLASPSVFREFI